MKRRNKRTITGAPQQETATLYARVKEENKEFVTKLADKHNVSECAVVDEIFDELRTHGTAKCSSLDNAFKSA